MISEGRAGETAPRSSGSQKAKPHLAARRGDPSVRAGWAQKAGEQLWGKGPGGPGGPEDEPWFSLAKVYGFLGCTSKSKGKRDDSPLLTLARTNSVQTRPHRSSSRGDHRAPKLWSWAPAAQKRAGEEQPPRGCQEKQEHGKFGRALGKKRLLAQLSVIFGDLTLGFAGWF